MKLLIGADLVPTKENTDLFISGEAEALVGQGLLDILKDADYRIFNLEVPMTDTPTPIEKCGPALRAPTATVAGYRALGVDLLTIANNHILDHGEEGLRSTVETLEKAGIAHVGCGDCLDSAAKPYILEREGKKIGIYACAEHEFSIAGENSPGANPFDPLESPDHVAALKAQCDYVIVLYHGGKEHYRYPAPNLQKVCRKLVEKGADLVVCQHSHCIGCEEKYLHGTIVYGQGNFLFDRDGSEYKATGILILLEDDHSIRYIPFVRDALGPRLARSAEKETLLGDFEKRSREMEDPQLLREKYAAFAREEKTRYLLAISGVNQKNIFRRVINRLSGYRFVKWEMGRKYNAKSRLVIRNYIECETQRELFLAGLKEKTDQK